MKMDGEKLLRGIGLSVIALFVIIITIIAGKSKKVVHTQNDTTDFTEENVLNMDDDEEMIACVVIDAGHGGFDVGASGIESGVHEDELNLSIAKLLRVALEQSNIEVIMTREDSGAIASNKRDDMRRRSEILNTPGITLTVSIHMNIFSDRSVSGPMVFYMPGSKEGQRLADDVIYAVCMALDRPTRQANPGDYYVLREGYAPAIIVECGFLSNHNDEQNLQDPVYQQKLTYGICSGILTYLGVE